MAIPTKKPGDKNLVSKLNNGSRWRCIMENTMTILLNLVLIGVALVLFVGHIS